VKYPGTYAIKNKGERISDVIKRAGGLTSEGFASGAVFSRLIDPAVRAERDRALDRVRRDREYGISLEKLQVASTAAVLGGAGGAGAQAGFAAAGNEQAAALTAALRSGDEASERVSIELAAIISNPKSRTDFVLRPGDNLTVPKQPYSVAIRGMVGSPTALAYVRGASLSYYLTRSGGVTKNGDLHRAFVVQPNGQVDAYEHHRILADRVPEPLAGSTIVIPPRESDVRVPSTNLPLVISAIASLTTAVFAIISLSK
jgi:protein involved in polysaccharide export with SLBB domain